MTPKRHSALTLKGNDIIPDQPLSDAEVNHLRRLLAWLDCEYFLSDAIWRGVADGLNKAAEEGYGDKAQEVADDIAAYTRNVPAYIRQAWRMLDRAVKGHERKAGVIE